jgi:hypothetical protein
MDPPSCLCSARHNYGKSLDVDHRDLAMTHHPRTGDAPSYRTDESESAMVLIDYQKETVQGFNRPTLRSILSELDGIEPIS